MKRTSLFVSAAALVVGLVACTASDVEASDYDQSCAQDDDCVGIVELSTEGTGCSVGCTSEAINKKDRAAYDRDFAEARSDCGTVSSPDCPGNWRPVCVQGRCDMRPPDGG